MLDREQFLCRNWIVAAVHQGLSFVIVVFLIVLLGLTFCYLCSLAVNSTGVSLPVALPAAPILGAAPGVSSLVGPMASVPGLSGLGVPGLQIPTATVPSVDTIGVPSECLLLTNMFDPKELEVCGGCLK